MRDFRLPPCFTAGLHTSGMLRGVVRLLVADVSGQGIGPIFEGQAVSLLGQPDPSIFYRLDIPKHL